MHTLSQLIVWAKRAWFCRAKLTHNSVYIIIIAVTHINTHTHTHTHTHTSPLPVLLLLVGDYWKLKCSISTIIKTTPCLKKTKNILNIILLRTYFSPLKIPIYMKNKLKHWDICGACLLLSKNSHTWMTSHDSLSEEKLVRNCHHFALRMVQTFHHI